MSRVKSQVDNPERISVPSPQILKQGLRWGERLDVLETKFALYLLLGRWCFLKKTNKKTILV